MKTQDIRVIDVLFLGPVMIAAGLATGPLASLVKTILIVGGIATIVYNWQNYLAIQNGKSPLP